MTNTIEKVLRMASGTPTRASRPSPQQKPVGRVTEPAAKREQPKEQKPEPKPEPAPDAPSDEVVRIVEAASAGAPTPPKDAVFSQPPSASQEPPSPVPVEERPKYRVLDKGEIGGVAVYSAEPRMQQAYRRFCRDGLGMGEFLPVTIPDGIGKLMSPLSLKLASDVLGCVSRLVESGEVGRVVVIVRRQDIDIPIVRHLVSVPEGKDFAAHVMSLGRATVKRRLGIDVEFYLAEVGTDGSVDFYRLD